MASDTFLKDFPVAYWESNECRLDIIWFLFLYMFSKINLAMKIFTHTLAHTTEAYNLSILAGMDERAPVLSFLYMSCF